MAEEKPGLLNKVLEGLTSLYLSASAMRCSDIASPNLRCLTAIINGGHEPGSLQGEDNSIPRSQTKRSLRPVTREREGFCVTACSGRLSPAVESAPQRMAGNSSASRAVHDAAVAELLKR